MTYPSSAVEVHALAVSRGREASLLLYALLFASTSMIVGLVWDISWHLTIGRDSFWTPAHLAIHLGGVVTGLTCGWVALHTTFAGTPEARAESVRFWGFRAPFGAWVCIWGAFAMLTSAPFDDWWHNTYGLDLTILSPPHALLASGGLAIQIGTMLLAVALQNRAGGATRRLAWMYLYAAGVLVLWCTTLGTDFLDRWDMHRPVFYQVACCIFPFLLASTARASLARWPATGATLVYMAVTMLMMWILQMFQAQPLLGPIYVHLDRFVPPNFPLLIVAPAVVIDLLVRRGGREHDWRLAAAIAVAFLAVFLPVQWIFADFYVSPWGRNWFFASHTMPYYVPPQMQQRWFQLNPPGKLATGLPIALVVAFVSARCGLWWGNWMSRVRR